MHNNSLKFAPVVELAKLNFTYITVFRIAKARPGFDHRPEYPSIQINSSSPWLYIAGSFLEFNPLFHGVMHISLGKYNG